PDGSPTHAAQARFLGPMRRMASCPAGIAPAGRPHPQPRRSFMSSATVGLPSDEARLVARLTLEQKIRLLTGADSWKLYGESAVGLRPIVMSDGPAGVRGARFRLAHAV